MRARVWIAMFGSVSKCLFILFVLVCIRICVYIFL